MATVFESTGKRQHFLLPQALGKDLRFKPNADGFGECNIELESARLGIPAQELVALITKRKEFSQSAAPGSGIWPKAARVKAANAEAFGRVVAATGMGEKELRANIAKLGGKAPVKATVEQLIVILQNLLAPDASDAKQADDSADRDPAEPVGARRQRCETGG